MRKNRTSHGERVIKDIKRKTRKQYSAEEKVRIVLDGLRGEDSIAELCRQEDIFAELILQMVERLPRSREETTCWRYIAPGQSSTEVKALRSEARELKECVAELIRENRLLKKSMLGNGGDDI